MAALDAAIQGLRMRRWMAGSKPGHDNGIGGGIRVIKSRKGGSLIRDRNEAAAFYDPGSRFACRDDNVFPYAPPASVLSQAAQHAFARSRTRRI